MQIIESVTKYLDPKTMILIGVVIAVFGTLFGGIGTYIHNIKSSEKTQRMLDQLSDAREELVQTRRQLTAAGSYAYLTAFPYESLEGYRIGLTLHHVGDYPLKHIRIEVVNVDEIIEGGSVAFDTRTIDDIRKYHLLGSPFVAEIPLLVKGADHSLNYILTVKKSEKFFCVKFVADNGLIWFQRIYLRWCADFPKNTKVESDGDELYSTAYQIYKEESFHDSKFQLHRIETILNEGCGLMIRTPLPKDFGAMPGSEKKARYWTFSLKEGEESPFVGNLPHCTITGLWSAIRITNYQESSP